MRRLRCALIGLGAAGSGMAVELLSRGHEICGWWDSDADIAPTIAAVGGLSFEGATGRGSVKLPAQSASAVDAIAGAEIIFVSTTADQHGDVAQRLKRAVEPGQIFVLNCGYVGGSKIFHDALETGTAYAESHIFELNTTLHLSGKISHASLFIRGVKKWMEISGPQAATGSEAFRALMQSFPEFAYTAGILESGLNNPNCIGHVPGAIGNAVSLGRELTPSSTGLLHYEEARMGRVSALCGALEAERDVLLRALGYEPLPVLRFNQRAYPAGSYLHGGIPRFGPMVQERYLVEDVPCALVPMESLGAMVGVETPVITAMITLGEIVADRNLRAIGRTVDVIGKDWVVSQLPKK